MNKLIIRMIPCECECECGTLIPEFDSRGRRRRFVNGHNGRGKTPSDATRQKLSIINSGENNPNYGKHHSPETKQKMSKIRKKKYSGENHPFFGKNHSPETRQKMSENHADISGENHPMYGKHHSPETKQLLSKIRKEKYSGENHPMYGRRGENSPGWKGGISKEPYCQEWSPWFKEEIKERDDYQCQNPDCNHKFEKLCVHHIDYDKKNCSCDNLITLCTSCNTKANFNREYWKEYYSNIITNEVNQNGRCDNTNVG